MAKFRTFPPYDKNEMSGYVNEGKKLPFSRMSNLFRTREGDVVTPYQTIVCRYYDSLKPYIEEKTFTEEEFEKYKYNPRFFCYDTYGTPELWADLLYINNMVSVTSFKKRTIKVFTVSIIEALIEIKLIIENDLIDNKQAIDNYEAEQEVNKCKH